MDDTEKLIILADKCSDMIFGGERGWERMPFNDFVSLVAERLKRQSTNFPLSHEGCDSFWKYWRENGETHKHGYYESTWGAIREYLKTAESTVNQRANAPKTKPRDS